MEVLDDPRVLHVFSIQNDMVFVIKTRAYTSQARGCRCCMEVSLPCRLDAQPRKSHNWCESLSIHALTIAKLSRRDGRNLTARPEAGLRLRHPRCRTVAETATLRHGEPMVPRPPPSFDSRSYQTSKTKYPFGRTLGGTKVPRGSGSRSSARPRAFQRDILLCLWTWLKILGTS